MLTPEQVQKLANEAVTVEGKDTLAIKVGVIWTHIKIPGGRVEYAADRLRAVLAGFAFRITNENNQPNRG